VLRFLEPFRYHDIAFYGMCMGCTVATRVPTPHTDLQIAHGRRLGDKRANETVRAFAENGIDMLALSFERAHQYGFKLLPTLRMSALYHRGPKYNKLAQWKLKNCHLLDYARPQVRSRMHIGNANTLPGAHQGLATIKQRFTQSCPQLTDFMARLEISGS
jgi:hypothetical protein